ncbi:MAG: oligopeptide transport system substrate-binding protein [Candidatus Azotimanducaceae bacterium]|jgi:oligopeptide transport system substrate-binding protein|tara:strand:+ start:840 stop:2540 length:1701 start_codon:yes stop_codon:yes gene_type:complete
MSSKSAKQPHDAAHSLSRQLSLYFFLALIFVAGLLFALNQLAGLMGTASQEAQAVDFANNSISAVLREEPPQLDSSKSTDSSSGLVLGHIMEGLLRMDLQDRLEPGVAERWQVTPTHATFWLRKDAKWSDGKPITAADFIFAWQLALKPETASQYATLLYPIENAEAINSGELPASALGVSAPDPNTLVVKLSRPVAFFDKLVVFPTFFPIREDFYKATQGRFGSDAKDLLYSGPYVIKNWVHSANMLLERNPHYWDNNRGKLAQINFAYITSDATATLNFFKDERIALARLQAENLTEALRLKWPIRRFADGTVFYLEFNHRQERISRNLNFRKAIQHVLDMEELVYKVTKLPGYLPGKSLFPEWLIGVEKTLREEYPATTVTVDHAKAKAYLALAQQELGLAKLPEITLLTSDNPVSNIQSEWLQEVLKQTLGITVKIDKQIFKQRLAKMTSGDFDLLLGGWGPDYNDPLTYGDLFASWNLNNRGKYNSPQMDELVATAQNATATPDRMQAFGDIQRQLFDDVVILPMYERGVTYVVHPQLKGVKRRVIGAETDYTYAYLDPDT